MGNEDLESAIQEWWEVSNPEDHRDRSEQIAAMAALNITDPEKFLDDYDGDQPRKREEARCLVRAVVSLLLYINGNDDLLELKAPPEWPMNKAKRRRLKKELGGKPPESFPQQFLVGSKFSSAIQRWMEQERADAARTGHTVKPHLRAAHVHKYRIGPGRTEIRVHFLPPIPVKGWEKPGEDPTTHRVF